MLMRSDWWPGARPVKENQRAINEANKARGIINYLYMNGEMIYPRCVNRLITKQEGRQTIREKSCSFHWHLTLGRSGTGAHKIAIRNCCCSRDSRIQGCLRFSICAAAGIACDWGRGDLTGVCWACTRRLRTACHRGHVASSSCYRHGGRCGLRTTALEEGTDRQIERQMPRPRATWPWRVRALVRELVRARVKALEAGNRDNFGNSELQLSKSPWELTL